MPGAAGLLRFFYLVALACPVGTNTFCQRNVKRVGNVPVETNLLVAIQEVPEVCLSLTSL